MFHIVESLAQFLLDPSQSFHHHLMASKIGDGKAGEFMQIREEKQIEEFNGSLAQKEKFSAAYSLLQRIRFKQTPIHPS